MASLACCLLDGGKGDRNRGTTELFEVGNAPLRASLSHRCQLEDTKGYRHSDSLLMSVELHATEPKDLPRHPLSLASKRSSYHPLITHLDWVTCIRQ